MFTNARLSPDSSRRGIALVLALSCIVLVTFLIIAFFSQSTSNRQVENSTAGRIKADILAQSAVAAIAGDLRQEMLGLSTVTQNNDGSVCLLPTTNVAMVPSRVLSDSTMASTPAFNNLVKQSISGQAIFSGSGGVIKGSSVHSSTPSFDGRYVTATRWNAPALIGDTNGLSGFTGEQTPDWVLLARGGPTTNTTLGVTAQGSLNNPVLSNSNFVIGRFAYNIYDEGGLLDINTVGYPSTVSGADRQILKCSLAGADLTALGIPGIDNSTIDKLVNWRNAASKAATWSGTGIFTSANWYVNYVTQFSGTTGYLQTFVNNADGNSSNDQRILSRQDLIRAATYGLLGTSGSVALPYLTTFSRDLNQPSFFHPANPAKIISSLAQGLETYGNDAARLSQKDIQAINPWFLNVRVTTAFARNDGTMAVIGEPLVKKRFPLSRIGLIRWNGSGSNQITKYFGLTRSGNSGPWIYAPDGASVTKINTLQDVADEGRREPNFIELLKAAITVGSLGKGAAQVSQHTLPAGFPGSGAAPDYSAEQLRNQEDISVDGQVIQIAANIIDQYDDDDYPTEIDFAVHGPNGQFGKYFGAENLPYLYAIATPAILTNNSNSSGVVTGTTYHYMTQIMLWNPHDPNTPPSSSRPTQFRVLGDDYNRGNAGVAAGGSSTDPQRGALSNPQAEIDFTEPSGAVFREPVLLNSTTPGLSCTAVYPGDTRTGFLPLVIAGTNNAIYSGTTETFVGFWVGDASCANGKTINPGLSCNIGVFYNLQYKSKLDNQWYTYDIGINDFTNLGHGTKFGFQVRTDPRTDRFGWAGTVPTPSSNQTQAENPLAYSYSSTGYTSIKPDTGAGFQTNTSGPSNNISFPNFYGTASGNRSIGSRSINRNDGSGSPYYNDPDGIVRGAMGYYSASALDGLPMAWSAQTGTKNARPIIINRAFRSVGDLGYVFRGTPWRNLDFAMPESGDAALLDVFCVEEDQTPDGVTAGVVNLNTRQAPVLQALLAGAAENELLLSSTITMTDIRGISKLLTAARGFFCKF